MPNEPIPVTRANEMIDEYVTYMKKLGVDMSKQTHTVSFTSRELMDWMQLVGPHTDEFKICYGNYPSGEARSGRNTVIIWPFKNGLPANWPAGEGKDGGGGSLIKPYNEGHLNP